MTLRIAINAQFEPDSGYGGVETVIVGLLAALARLTDGDEEYVVIGPPTKSEWLTPYLGANQRVVPFPLAGGAPLLQAGRGLRKWAGPAYPAFQRVWRAFYRLKNRPSSPWANIPISNGFFESLGCQAIHFPFQQFFVCSLPSIFNPHDLQHLHLPWFFTPAEIVARESLYRQACQFARCVAVGSQWVKDDVVRQYGLSEDKVQVVPWASPTAALGVCDERSVQSALQRHRLEPGYLFYPAKLWPHKNHLRLLEALVLLRDRQGLKPRLVCTGSRDSPHRPVVERYIRDHHLESQTRFLGIVPKEELRPLYRGAACVVVPTLFEAASAPVFEAWQEGKAVACSTVTSLPEQAGGAALLFDPHSVEEIAASIQLLLENVPLRRDMEKRGVQRLKDFSWDKTARAYRAIYRRCAGIPLSDEERQLLHVDWTRKPGACTQEKS